MAMDFLYALLLLVVAANAASAAYVLIAIRRVGQFRQATRPEGDFRPPVTVFKPVCGLDADLYENLRSFCRQDYPEYQILFGVRDAVDPAISVIRRLLDAYPDIDMMLIVDESLVGPNFKASNLSNMDHAAKHSYLIIADSDMRVCSQYIASVVSPFADPEVGVVTCLYKGSSAGGVASVLGGMFINGWFLPSVLVSAGMRDIRFCLGATMAVRRDVLEIQGGFKNLAAYLADDHMLGKFASAHGFKVVLSRYVVENVVFEESLSALFRHELRWARTTRVVAPLGHAFSFIMYGVPLAVVGALLIGMTFGWGGAEIAAIVLSVALAVVLRTWMHATVARKFRLRSKDRAFWLVPARDILSFVIWGASYLGRGINWKDTTFIVDSEGLMATADE